MVGAAVSSCENDPASRRRNQISAPSPLQRLRSKLRNASSSIIACQIFTDALSHITIGRAEYSRQSARSSTGLPSSSSMLWTRTHSWSPAVEQVMLSLDFAKVYGRMERGPAMQAITAMAPRLGAKGESNVLMLQSDSATPGLEPQICRHILQRTGRLRLHASSILSDIWARVSFTTSMPTDPTTTIKSLSKCIADQRAGSGGAGRNDRGRAACCLSHCMGFADDNYTTGDACIAAAPMHVAPAILSRHGYEPQL